MIACVIIIALLASGLVNATTFKDCDIMVDGESIQPVIDLNIEDVSRGILLNLTTTGVDIMSISGPSGTTNYFTIKSDSWARYQLTTSYRIDELEKERPSQSKPLRILLEINVLCLLTANYLYIDVHITDSNNNQPMINGKDGFQYEIALPFPTRTPLHVFGKYISAVDYDIQNVMVTFKLEPDNVFKVDSQKDVTDPLGKNYTAIITAIKPIVNLDTTIFTLTALDQDGVESKPRNITIFSHPDPEWNCGCTPQNMFVPLK